MQPKQLLCDPDELTPNAYNTNVVSPENEAKLEESIRRNGLFKPVVVREFEGTLEIIGGQHRWEIAKKLGIKVPVMNLGPIDDQKAKEISIADNARYGADDTIAFAELLKEIGEADDLQSFLPYTETDFAEIFSSTDIDVDDLDLDDDFESSAKIDAETEEPAEARPPKTHTIMRFKVPIADAERITALVARTQKDQGLTEADDLTNAGDALVHLLLSAPDAPAEDPDTFTLDDMDEA